MTTLATLLFIIGIAGLFWLDRIPEAKTFLGPMASRDLALAFRITPSL